MASEKDDWRLPDDRIRDAAPALLAACEAAEFWLEQERANPGQTQPFEILRVLAAAIIEARGPGLHIFTVYYGVRTASGAAWTGTYDIEAESWQLARRRAALRVRQDDFGGERMARCKLGREPVDAPS